MLGLKKLTLLLLLLSPILSFSQKTKKYTYTFTVTMVPQSCGGREVSQEEQIEYVKNNSKLCTGQKFAIYDNQKPSVILKEIFTNNKGCFVFTADEGGYKIVLDTNNYLVPTQCRHKIVSSGFRVLKNSTTGDQKILLSIPTPDCCKGQRYE